MTCVSSLLLSKPDLQVSAWARRAWLRSRYTDLPLIANQTLISDHTGPSDWLEPGIRGMMSVWSNLSVDLCCRCNDVCSTEKMFPLAWVHVAVFLMHWDVWYITDTYWRAQKCLRAWQSRFVQTEHLDLQLLKELFMLLYKIGSSDKILTFKVGENPVKCSCLTTINNLQLGL